MASSPCFQKLLLVQRSSTCRGAMAINTRRGFASSRREVPLPPLTNPVEQAIVQARLRGEFDGLSGAGKPLQKSKETSPLAGITTSTILSMRAEFEMRRAVHNKELEHLAGQKLEYKGTSIVSPTSAGGDGGDGGDAMLSQYILKEAQPSAAGMKNMNKK
jgi:hypothetical protein